MENQEIVETVVEQVAENTLGTTTLAVLGTAVPVVGLAVVAGSLLGRLFSSEDDGAEQAFKDWEKTQSLPVSEIEAHGFVNGYRWAKK